MNEVIIVSMSGDTVTISTEPARGGLLMDKEGLLSLLSLFIGKRSVFYKREHEPAKTETQFLDWNREMALHFGVQVLQSMEQEASDCPECGRLVQESGLCGHCADRKAGFSR